MCRFSLHCTSRIHLFTFIISVTKLLFYLNCALSSKDSQKFEILLIKIVSVSVGRMSGTYQIAANECPKGEQAAIGGRKASTP